MLLVVHLLNETWIVNYTSQVMNYPPSHTHVVGRAWNETCQWHLCHVDTFYVVHVLKLALSITALSRRYVASCGCNETCYVHVLKCVLSITQE